MPSPPPPPPQFHLEQKPYLQRSELPVLLHPIPVQGQLRYHVNAQLLEHGKGPECCETSPYTVIRVCMCTSYVNHMYVT